MVTAGMYKLFQIQSKMESISFGRAVVEAVVISDGNIKCTLGNVRACPTTLQQAKFELKICRNCASSHFDAAAIHFYLYKKHFSAF